MATTYPDYRLRPPAAYGLGELWDPTSGRHATSANDLHYQWMVRDDERQRAQWCLNCPAPDCTGSKRASRPRRQRAR